MSDKMSVFTSDKHIVILGEQLERNRLMQNIPQTELAQLAGISARTLRRIESGEGASMDSFIRVLMALKIDGNLSVLIPDSTVRPMERTRPSKAERVRASKSRKTSDKTASTQSATSTLVKPDTKSHAPGKSNWTWGDEQP